VLRDGTNKCNIQSPLLLHDDGITRYRICIGCINWAVTIGRFDTMFAAFTMATYSAVPREGHLKVALRIIGYLKYHAKGAIQMIVEKPNFELENDSDLLPSNGERSTQKLEKRSLYNTQSQKANQLLHGLNGMQIMITILRLGDLSQVYCSI